jgi:phage terminase Nu1 subunit (DNA packaging protein)
MAIVGDLVANLTANASGFLAGVDAAARSMTGLVGAVAVNSGKLAGAAATTAKATAQATAIISRAKAGEAMSYARTAAIARQSLAKQANDQKLTAAKIVAMQAKTALAAQKAQAQAMKGAATSGILQASAIIMAFRTVGRVVSGSIQAFRDSEQAGKKLDSVLASTGGAAGLTGEEIRKLAGDLQAVTNYEDDATIGAAGVLATFTQIRGDVFKSALMAAQDLSSVMGTDLQSSVVQVGKALNDPIRGITALSRVGVSFSQEQKDQIKRLQESGDLTGAQAVILAELQTEFGGAARAMADPLAIVSNQIGDIAENFGGLLLPAIHTVAQSLVSVLAPISEKIAANLTTWGDVLAGYVGDAIAFIRDSVALAGAAISNMGSILKLAFLEVQIAALQFGLTIEHMLTVQTPEYLQWFADNWRDVFRSLYDFTNTIFANLGNNIGRQMEDIWDYVASGGTDALEATWTPLTDGFESSIKELPKISERIPGELERGLALTADALRAQIASGFIDAVKDSAVGIDEVARPTFEGLKTRAADIVTETEGQLQAFESKGPSAAMQGSSEALQAIFGAMRQDDYQRQQMRLLQEQNAIGRDQLAAIRDMADSDETVGIE